MNITKIDNLTAEISIPQPNKVERVNLEQLKRQKEHLISQKEKLVEKIDEVILKIQEVKKAGVIEKPVVEELITEVVTSEK